MQVVRREGADDRVALRWLARGGRTASTVMCPGQSTAQPRRHRFAPSLRQRLLDDDDVEGAAFDAGKRARGRRAPPPGPRIRPLEDPRRDGAEVRIVGNEKDGCHR